MSNQLQISGGAKVRNLEGVLTGTSGVVSSLGINVPSGIPQLDGSGKILVSQLPNSVMEFKGTWNAATNTPTLANGTGNAGDVYLCNVAGTVNFGAGPITFYVGDQVLYSGTVWQRASGSSGSVTSVAVTESGDALTITGSPITTSGTINIGFAGTGAQYIKGDGTLATFPTTIDQARRLITEVYNSTGATLTKGTVVYINGGQGNLPTVTKAQANSDANSAQTYGVVQSDITNMNNGYVVVSGSLTDLDTQAYAVGTQLYLSSTTAGAWTSTKQYAPAHLVYVAIVVRSHPTQGVVEVRIQNGYELDELHNVSAQTPSNNDGIFYNSSNSLWEAKSIPTALGYTPLSGGGTAGNIPYYTGTYTLGNENGFMYDSSTNRFGVNTTVPNATIGANASIDSGYSLLLKNADANYNGIGFGINTTYGNTFETQKLGVANAMNLTLLNQSGYISLTEGGNLGINILSPIASPSGIGSKGIDIYGDSQAASIGFHNVASGTGNTNGAYLYLTNTGTFTLRNLEGGIGASSLGDFSVVTNSTENFRVNSVDGTIWQSNIPNALLKTVSGVLTAAVAGTDYVAPSALSSYVPTSRTITINGTTQDLSANRSWSVGTVTGSGTATRVAFWDGSSSLSSNTNLYWDNTNSRLGVGLTNPQRALEIYSASADTHLRLSGAAPSVSMGEAITGAIYQAKFGLATANNQFVTGSVAGDFVINCQTGSSIFAYNSTEAMRIDTNRNVGIGGIANSSYRLHVFGTAPILAIESNTTGNVTLRFLQTGFNVSGISYINSDSSLRFTNNNGALIFNTGLVNGALTLASGGAATFSSTLTTGGTVQITGAGSPTTGAGLEMGYGNFTAGRTTITSYNRTGAAYVGNDYNALDYIWYTSGSQKMTLTNGGNVGIGTTSPSALLHLSQTTSNLNLYLQNTSASGKTWAVNSDENGKFNIHDTVSNRLTISGGNVGIGTTSPSGILDIKASSGATITNLINNAASLSAIVFQESGSNRSFIQYLSPTFGTSSRANSLEFGTLSSAFIAFRPNDTEAMRIKSTGSIVNSSTTNDTGGRRYYNYDGGSGNQNGLGLDMGGNSYEYSLFFAYGTSDNGRTTIGSYDGTTYRTKMTVYGNGNIGAPTGSNIYNASDIRLKKNINTISYGIKDVMKLNPVLFNWINGFEPSEDNKDMLGFIAQEVKEIIPEAVENFANNTITVGDIVIENTLRVNEKFIIPVLVKAIQELKLELDELKAKIN